MCRVGLARKTVTIPDQSCCRLGRFCFCSLHAHMRLTEALVKPMFARAIASHREFLLSMQPFVSIWAWKTRLQKCSQIRGQGKYGSRCRSRPSSATLLLKKLSHALWPDGEEPAAKPASGAQSSAAQSGEKKRKRQRSKIQRDSEWGSLGAQQKCTSGSTFSCGDCLKQ
jgi:hypothetical protein